jgi:hypothetical protein
MKVLLVAASAVAALGVGAAASPSGSSCFFVRDVGDRTVGGPHTLYFKVKDTAHMHAVAYYHVETSGRCMAGMTSPTQHSGFAVDAWPLAAGAAAKVCSQKELVIDGGGGHCDVVSLSRMTPAEVAALPRGLRP